MIELDATTPIAKKDDDQWAAKNDINKIDDSKLGDRSEYIGGSEIAAVMGLSRFKTPLSVWAEKTKKIPPKDLSDNEAVEMGRELEDYVAYKFGKKAGLKVRRDNRTFQHPEYPFIRGHIDRTIVGADAILECKTTSAWNAKNWEGEEIPIEYVMQLVLYLGLTQTTIGYIAVLIGGQKFQWKQIEFDQTLYDQMVEAARSFWQDYVETEIAPMAMADDDETLKAMFPDALKEEAELTQELAVEIDGLVEERQGGKEQAADIEADLNRIENRIKQILGDASAATTDSYVVTWKSQDHPSVDTEAMKRDGVYDKYKRVSRPRVLRTKARKPAKGATA